MRSLAALALPVAAFVAAPVSAQTPTLKLNGPPLANALGEPVAKTWTVWQDQQRRALAKIKPPVGDVAEPELGVNFDKIPQYVPSNFDREALLVPAWGGGGIPEKSKEGVGAFRFMCSAGQVLRDDPIVWPNQPGKSHLHQFFGNTGANANSTYRSLRETGESTCVNKLNRSAYWLPAMLDGKGNVVRPDYVTTYYKSAPQSSPDCRSVVDECVAMPRAMRFIFGFDMINMKSAGEGVVSFNCEGPTAGGGSFKTLAQVAKVCGVGNRIIVRASSPFCWDGKRIDSKDHRSHVGYAGWDDGKLRCDKDHRKGIPAFSIAGAYAVEEGDNPAIWSYSSDDMTAMGHGKMEAGSTVHVDFMPAWDEPVEHDWFDNCINKELSCNGGDLGNGKQLKDTTGFDWKAHPHLVPIPEVR